MAPWLALDFPYGELRTAEDVHCGAPRAARPPQESEQLRFRVPGESRPVGLGAEITRRASCGRGAPPSLDAIGRSNPPPTPC